MRNIALVAKREYLEQIRGRAFRVSTILVPVLFAVIIGVAYLSGRGSGVGKHVIVAAPSCRACRGHSLPDRERQGRQDHGGCGGSRQRRRIGPAW